VLVADFNRANVEGEQNSSTSNILGARRSKSSLPRFVRREPRKNLTHHGALQFKNGVCSMVPKTFCCEMTIMNRKNLMLKNQIQKIEFRKIEELL
jgi:hypothetical protein